MERNDKFNLVEYHYRSEHDVIISYKGPFDKNAMGLMGNYIRGILSMNPQASKKVFKIFIELAQNIAQYSAEKNIIGDYIGAGVGTLVLVEYESYYYLITGNLIKNESIGPVIDKCELINTLDKEGLRKLKREHLKHNDHSRTGADIGFIQLAITSANPLDIEVKAIDEKFSFFTIRVKINK
ncbi:MAG: hypothetical protein GY705_05770 [Bacteroidetes bacterium]|nr:hypothetical protein [Bacteroidota bacterium]